VPRLRLTEKAVDKLQAPTKSGKPVLYWDDGPRAVRGFGVLCSGKTSGKTYVAQRDLPGGRTRRVTVAGVNEMKLVDAREAAANTLVNLRRGIDPKVKKETTTLRTVLHAYRAGNTHRLRPRSEQSYQSTIERHLSDWLDRPLTEIARDMVEARHRLIAEEIEARHTKAAVESAKRFETKAGKAEALGWAEAAARYRAAATKATQRKPASGHATANGVMRALRLLWNFAADRNPVLGPNPVRLKKQWFPVPRRERLVRADDLPRFYDAVTRLENPVQRDYLLLLLFTGLRRREAAGLRWSDVDLKARLLRISAASTKAKRKLDLPLSDVVHDMLVARRALGDSTFIFPANSKSGHLAEPKFALDQIAKVSSIRISAHDLRRTFITVAESCDISPLALKMLVNHAIGGDVTSGYVIMTTERLREPAQKVADRLKSLCGIAEPTGANISKLKA
jgi:integrase